MKLQQQQRANNHEHKRNYDVGIYAFLCELALVGGIASGAWRNDFMYHSEIVNKFYVRG